MGGRKKKTLMQNPSSVCNGTPTGLTFFLPTTNPVTSSWKQNNDIISDLIALTVGVDLSPRLVLLFLVSSGITRESKPPLGKENLLFLERFLFSQSGCLIYTLESDEGWSYSKACFFLIGLFFVQSLSLLSLFQNFR